MSLDIIKGNTVQYKHCKVGMASPMQFAKSYSIFFGHAGSDVWNSVQSLKPRPFVFWGGFFFLLIIFQPIQIQCGSFKIAMLCGHFLKYLHRDEIFIVTFITVCRNSEGNQKVLTLVLTLNISYRQYNKPRYIYIIIACLVLQTYLAFDIPK